MSPASVDVINGIACTKTARGDWLPFEFGSCIVCHSDGTFARSDMKIYCTRHRRESREKLRAHKLEQADAAAASSGAVSAGGDPEGAPDGTLASEVHVYGGGPEPEPAVLQLRLDF